MAELETIAAHQQQREGKVTDILPSQLLLEIHHVLVTLCVICSLGLHEVIQAA